MVFTLIVSPTVLLNKRNEVVFTRLLLGFPLQFKAFVALLFSDFVSGGECHFIIAGRVVRLPTKLEMARFTEQPHIRDSSRHWKTQVC